MTAPNETKAAADWLDALDATRYRWLAERFAKGEETYIGEWCRGKDDLDKRIDGEMKKESSTKIILTTNK